MNQITQKLREAVVALDQVANELEKQPTGLYLTNEAYDGLIDEIRKAVYKGLVHSSRSLVDLDSIELSLGYNNQIEIEGATVDGGEITDLVEEVVANVLSKHVTLIEEDIPEAPVV